MGTVTMRRRLVVALGLAALGLSACGGSSQPRVASSAGQPTTAQTTQATQTTAPNPAPRQIHKRATRPHASEQATTTAGAGAPAAKRSAPLDCLRGGGLANVLEPRAGVWSGQDRRTLALVLVDGPYKTAGEAADSAASLAAASLARGGGRYVVSAPLTSKLDADIAVVAKCLSARGK
jgi:hypothetical protein